MKGQKLKNVHKVNCKCSFCYKSGKNNPHFGKPHSKELKKRFSLERQGKDNPFFGKKHSNETKQFLRESQLQEKSSSWKGGITPLIILIRNLLEMKQWRISVFKYDNYTCQECDIKNGNGRSVEFEAHHKKPFSNILQEFLQEYSQFSPIEDKETLLRLATTYEPFWDTNNGKTLCKDCHNLTKRGRHVN